MRQPPDRLSALLWAIFAQCAVITAILVSAHILVQGLLGPLGVLPYPDRSYEAMARAFANPLVKVYFFVLFASSFYVFGHRLRYLLLDLGLHRGKRLFGLLLYGLAGLGTVAAGYVLITVP